LFAGGGTGGHIYPNVAIVEKLAALRADLTPYFLVSDRPGDAAVLDRLGYRYARSPVRPLPRLSRPLEVARFLWRWRQAVAAVRALLASQPIAALVATGGFVSGPAIVAAARMGLPRALVNLDALPGRANRRLARSASQVLTVYPSAVLPTATPIGFPLRAASRTPGSRAEARAALGLALEPHVPLLFVTGATHGAESIVRMMTAWCESVEWRRSLQGWHVLHQCGALPLEPIARAYAAAGLHATVVATVAQMGCAFGAADLAIGRAGAGTVAEAWANATPTVFLPNPYHHDQHQRHNAQPMVDAGGALVMQDRIDAPANLAATVPVIAQLLSDESRRRTMHAALLASRPSDGAAAVAAWISAVVAAR
jgi:UDP-N-acetylglucosamine--N-acetylmuramyl-(pentapeptide) pyrophosphoryl-undecaprenol N-acetylglucosamine transferase